MSVNSINEHPLVVDLSSRTISIPDELKYIAVATDNNSEKVWFNVPRYFDEPDVQGNGDLLQKVAQVHFLNAGGSFGVYTINEVRENEDGTISLAWLIEKDVTMVAGEVKFQLVFTLFDNGDNVYKLSTTPATLIVRAGIDSSEFSIAKESKTYEQLIELIYDGYETLKAVDIETLRHLSASPKGVVDSLATSGFENLETGIYLYMPDDVTEQYYGYIVYWNGLTVSDPIIKYLTVTFSNSCIETVHIADGAVTTAKLANNAVTNTKLSDNAITMSKLANATYATHDEGDDDVVYGVVDAVEALKYRKNIINKIGVLTDGHYLYRMTIDRQITSTEITSGYVEDILSDIDVHKIISVDVYMVSDDGVLVPLNYIFSNSQDIIYLKGISCESTGMYAVRPSNNETWYLRGNIIFALENENENEAE